MSRTYLKQCHLYKLVHGLYFQTLLYLITFALVEAMKIIMLTVHVVAFDSGIPLYTQAFHSFTYSQTCRISGESLYARLLLPWLNFSIHLNFMVATLHVQPL